MIFEIVLTDKCTRKCAFCNFAKNEYIESLENIDIFCKKIDEYNLDFFEIVFFGGEPLLNNIGLKKIIDHFKDKNCRFKLITNGDLLEKNLSKDYIDKLYIQLSAYDILKTPNKYDKLIQNIHKDRLMITYTFSEDDLDHYFKYIDICKSKNINYKFSLSHTLSSWKNIDEETLYLKARLIFENEILDSIKNKKISNSIKSKIQKSIQIYYNINNINNNINKEEYYCFNKNKKVFYKGRFIDSCFLCNKIPDSVDDFCVSCKYRKICYKSCLDERVEGKLPKKLCLIQKAEFDAIDKYFKLIYL